MGKQTTLVDVDSFQLPPRQQKVEISLNIFSTPVRKTAKHRYFEVKHWQLDVFRVLFPEKTYDIS